jgi:NitT/TauT family transport system permease protein
MRRILDWVQIRGRVGNGERFILGAVPPFVLLAIWFLCTWGSPESRWISPIILPSPREVLGQVHSLWFEAEFSRSAMKSFLRVLEGFVIGVLVALPIGIAMGAFGRAKALFSPSATFLSYLPIPALVPLTMSLFGIDELQKVTFLALAFAIYLTPLFVQAIDDVDTVYLHTAATMGARRFAAIFKVLVPIAAPGIVQAMRLGFGVGWTYIILAEMVAADRGLGQIIIIAQRRGPREHIYLTLIGIVAIAWLTDRGWAWLHKTLFPYKYSR